MLFMGELTQLLFKITLTKVILQLQYLNFSNGIVCSEWIKGTALIHGFP